MSMIESRVSKLEQSARIAPDERSKRERDAEYAAYIARLLPIAALCNSPEELAAHMKSSEHGGDEQVVSLDVRQREDAVRASLARTIWEEARG